MSNLRKPARSALDLIGTTPVVELTRLDTGVCRLFVKLENTNPGGSIKDRVALSMIAAAEADGRLKPGGTIIEATAGNTGLGLAQVGLPKGYNVILVVPDKMSREKIAHLRAFGTDVRITRSDVGKGHPAYYQDMAERLATELGAFYVNQFANKANGWRTKPPPARRSSSSSAATSTRWWSASARAARSQDWGASSPRPRRRPGWCWPIRKGRSWRRWSTQGS